MRKLLLVGGPLAIYLLTVAVRLALGRRPTRHAMNVEVAILLTLYFLTTAGLGIFWVANQQLPPFDLHYLFGYATFALVMAHLAYNARIVVAYVRKARGRAGHAAPSPSPRWAGQVAAGLVVAGVAFYLGVRSAPPSPMVSGRGAIGAPAAGSTTAEDAQLDLVAQYHAMSSHTRAGVMLRAPSVAWDLPVDRYLDRGDAPRIGLPAPARALGEVPGAPPSRPLGEALAAVPRRGVRFGRDHLATLLWATAGISERRGGLDLRASASSGALFPTEIYVLAFGVADLAPGTYAYAPDEHALVDLGRAPVAAPELGLDPGAPPTLLLVATGVFRRTGQKYRDRAYRYVLADAGHAVGNALVAGGELGLATRLVPRFDDAAVARAVGADDVTEGVIAVLAMTSTEPGERPPPADDAAALHGGLGPGRSGGLAPATTGDGFAPVAPIEPSRLELGATSMVHVATSLAFDAAASPRHQDPVAGPRVALPVPDDAPADVLALVASRRSARTFERGPVPVADVAAVLRLAAGPPPVASGATRVHVVTSRVEGVEAGVARLEGHALIRTRTGDRADEAGRAALDQDVVGTAPVVVVLTVDRDALARDGARGYRHAFLEAGILGARLYLAAGARGLGGCSVGAFYDDEAARLLGVDLDREWPVHFFALGRVR